MAVTIDLMWVSFRKFDKSNDGKISLQEMLDARKKGLEMTKREVRQLMKVADQSGDQELDFAEFFKFMTNSPLDPRVSPEIIRAFSAIDKNGDGSISRKELQSARRNGTIKITKDDANAIIDAAGDDKLTLSQFTMLIAGKPAGEPKRVVLDEDDLYALFQLLDEDRSGYLSPAEVVRAGQLLELPPAETQKIMMADRNGDGRLSFPEFRALFG